MSQNRNHRASVLSHPEKQMCSQLLPFFLLLCTQQAPGNLPVLVLQLQSPVTLLSLGLCRVLVSDPAMAQAWQPSAFCLYGRGWGGGGQTCIHMDQNASPTPSFKVWEPPLPAGMQALRPQLCQTRCFPSHFIQTHFVRL